VEFTPANSFWNDFSALNNYVARVQSFLQSSKPDNDILFYFPIFDRYSDNGNVMLEHFDAISPRFNGTPFRTGAQVMLDKGYAFDFISDKQIKNILVYDGLLKTEGNTTYKTLVLPGSKYIPLETFNNIINLADKGATIIIFGNLPGDVSGWANLESNRELFRHLIDQMKFNPTSDTVVKQTSVGKGRILFGNDLEKLLSFASIRRESIVDNGLKFTRRTNKNESYYFILNPTNKPFEGWIALQVKARSVGIYNPMTLQKGVAKTRIASAGNVEVYAKLLPQESLVISTFDAVQGGEKFIFYDTISTGRELKGSWKIDFLEGGPELPASKEVAKLGSWTDLGGEAVKNFSGTAKYTINFSKPEGKADGWLLNLGKVCESARIILNNNELTTLLGPEYQIVIEKHLLKSQNTLEIKVSNLAANRIAYLDRNNVKWKKFYNTNFPARMRQNSKNGLFDASAWLPRESGLIGPVTLTAVKKVK